MANNRFTPQIIAMQSAPIYAGNTVTDGTNNYVVSKFSIDTDGSVHVTTPDGTDVVMDDLKAASKDMQVLAVRYDNIIYTVGQYVAYKAKKATIAKFTEDLKAVVLITNEEKGIEELITAEYENLGIYAKLYYSSGTIVEKGDSVNVIHNNMNIQGKIDDISLVGYGDSGLDTIYKVVLSEVFIVNYVDGKISTENKNTYEIQISTSEASSIVKR